MQHKFVEGPYSELINYDTTLWQEESDNYLYRSIESSKGIGNLYSSDDEWSIFFKSTVEQYLKSPEKICDIGCSFGHAIHSLVDVFKGAEIIGIDPGEKAIKTAIANIKSDRVKFKVGHSHSLPVLDNSVDVIILRMVLQWIPRNKLLQTISEIDRVLKVKGVIWLQDFLPNKPVTSKSCHNNSVYIFKENYPDYFLSCPWYREVFRRVSKVEEGEDQQRHISIIQKYKLRDVYLLKSGVTEPE